LLTCASTGSDAGLATAVTGTMGTAVAIGLTAFNLQCMHEHNMKLYVFLGSESGRKHNTNQIGSVWKCIFSIDSTSPEDDSAPTQSLSLHQSADGVSPQLDILVVSHTIIIDLGRKSTGLEDHPAVSILRTLTASPA
jgi:hypothetical protein